MGQIDPPSPGNVIPDLSRNRVNLTSLTVHPWKYLDLVVSIDSAQETSSIFKMGDALSK